MKKSIQCLYLFWYMIVFIIKLFKFVNNVVLKPLYTCYRWNSHKTYHVVQFCGLMFSTRNFAGKTLFEIGMDRYDLIKIWHVKSVGSCTLNISLNEIIIYLYPNLWYYLLMLICMNVKLMGKLRQQICFRTKKTWKSKINNKITALIPKERLI